MMTDEYRHSISSKSLRNNNNGGVVMSPMIGTRISTCLWFEFQAEEAASFYTSIFKNSRIINVVRFGKERHPIEGIEEGMAMTVAFELDGHEFVALNGGPQFKFNEAVSMVVKCHSQDEIDYYWDSLSVGGDERAQVCGWLKDQYGLSWQIVPVQLTEMLSDPDTDKSERVTKVMLQMKKLDLQALQLAYEGL
jgi:predicted 3-demethylubiquinone-9 3-methyltransferase (glyoxalase superfamily)